MSRADFEKYGTIPKKDVIIELARCDIQNGLPIEAIVYGCCYGPVKSTVQAVLELGDGVTEEKVKRVLALTDDLLTNCLMQCYALLREPVAIGLLCVKQAPYFY